MEWIFLLFKKYRRQKIERVYLPKTDDKLGKFIRFILK